MLSIFDCILSYSTECMTMADAFAPELPERRVDGQLARAPVKVVKRNSLSFDHYIRINIPMLSRY